MTGNLLPGAECSLAKRLLCQHRERNELLGQQLFGESAWPILLALYIARADGLRITLPRLCANSGSSQRAVRRWTDILVAEGKVTEQENAVELTPRFADQLQALFRAWLRDES